MRVLLDVSAIPDEPVGAGVYVMNLTRTLDAGSDVQLDLLTRRGDRARWKALAPRARIHDRVPEGRPLRLAWEQLGTRRFARRLGTAVWHGPHYTLPLKVDATTVVTIHDMTFFDFPEYHERAKVVFFQQMIKAAARRADVLVAVSEATARRVREVLHPRGPVVVAPHGVDRARYRPAADDQTTEADLHALAEVGVRPPFIVHVGTLEPRKNVPGLVDAFASLSPRHPDLQLVIAGRPGWGSRDVDAAVRRSGARERILELGYIPAELVPALYRQAAAVVYASMAEGFGLPALEALACAAPLVTSVGTPMADFAADAAVLVRPESQTELAEAIERILTSEKLTRRLREEGPRVAGRFSWGLCARAHVDAYRMAAEAR